MWVGLMEIGPGMGEICLLCAGTLRLIDNFQRVVIVVEADGSIILLIYYVRFTINCSLFRSFLFGEIRRHVNGHVTMKG